MRCCDAVIVAVIVTAVAALANWWSRVRHESRVELLSKPLATAGAIAIAATAGGPGRATALAIVALALCLIGDVALLPAVDRFIVGLAAFLLGHVAFIAMFAALGFDRWSLGGIGLAGCALALGTVAVPIMRGASGKGLGVPVRFYFAVISAMCILGWATGNWLVMLGATAFIISDTILGWGQFVRERNWMHLAIMVTYHIAIASLALSLAL
jgi:uncharacterized membrane protein YhhN